MKPYILGITGPSGAGKAELSQALSKYGFAVIDADKSARAAAAPGSPMLECIKKAFGSGVIRPDGSLDRAALAKAAFSSEKGTELLNGVTHPHIIKYIGDEIEKLAEAGHNNIILDAPTLFESGADAVCSFTAAVLAPREVRRQRIILRDNLSEKAADLRLGAGRTDEFYTSRADFVIHNDFNGPVGDKAALLAGAMRKAGWNGGNI